MALTLRYSAVSDIGRTRKKNDDSGYAGPHLVMVADGMGGAAAGDVASAVAVATLQRLDAPAPDDMLVALAGAVHRANDRLAELIEEDAAVEGMGTTLTAVLFDGAQIAVAHLGDSRGYLWQDGELRRITHDHTWVQSLVDDGRITDDEARVHSHRSLLLKVLDGRNDNDPDLTVYDVELGDRILICSDGLSGFVEHDRMERVLSIGTAESVAHELLQLALEAGSNDNVTVVVADVVDEESVEEDVEEPVIVGSAAQQAMSSTGRIPPLTYGGRDASGQPLVGSDLDPEELRYAPRAPRRFRWLVRIVALAVALATLTFVTVLAYNWSQSQYYVASYGERVAIYQGVQADLPGISLHHVYATEDLLLTELPTFRRSQVLDGLQAEDLDHAQGIVDELTTFAATCATRAARSSSATQAPTTTTRTTNPAPHPKRSGATSTDSTRGPQTPRGTAGPQATRGTAGATPASRGATGSKPPAGSAQPRTPPASTGDAQTTSPSSGGTDHNAAQECSGATPVPGTTS